MICWEISASATGAPSFVERHRAVPEPKGRDLLVEVRAVSVNPVDLKTAKAWAAAGRHGVAGWDAAGIVVSSGPEAELFGPGDAVWYAGDITRPGSNAEYQLVDERIGGRKPTSLDFVEAAAMPLTTLTAWEALFERLRLPERSDDGAAATGRLLVINGAGGVGSVAIQLARRANVAVVATASRSVSREWCLSMGATDVVDHRALSDLDADSFDWVLCCHDTDLYFETSARLVRPFGAIAFLASATRPHDIQLLMRKSAGIVWEFVFTRSSFSLPDMVRQHEILTAAADMVDAGELRCTLTKRMAPLNAETLSEAHRQLAAGAMVGKLAIGLRP